MDFLKLIDNFEQTVAQAASAVVESASEFPKPQTDSTRTAQQLVSTTVAANQAKQAESTWEQFDWQQQVTRLQQDQAEVNKLLQDFHTEQAAHAALQAAHRALHEEFAAAKSITASAGKLEAQVQDQQATISSQQVSILKAKLAAADSRLDRLSAELERRPSASAAASMAQQLAAATALLGQQLEGEGWGLQGAATAVEAVRADPLEQLEPLLVASLSVGPTGA
eukprot:gene11435-11581_t